MALSPERRVKIRQLINELLAWADGCPGRIIACVVQNDRPQHVYHASMTTPHLADRLFVALTGMRDITLAREGRVYVVPQVLLARDEKKPRVAFDSWGTKNQITRERRAHFAAAAFALNGELATKETVS